MTRKPFKTSSMSDAELARAYDELSYRKIEVAVDPDHPASRANGRRWAMELRKVVNEGIRRGLLEAPKIPLDDRGPTLRERQ